MLLINSDNLNSKYNAYLFVYIIKPSFLLMLPIVNMPQNFLWNVIKDSSWNPNRCFYELNSKTIEEVERKMDHFIHRIKVFIEQNHRCKILLHLFIHQISLHLWYHSNNIREQIELETNSSDIRLIFYHSTLHQNLSMRQCSNFYIVK